MFAHREVKTPFDCFYIIRGTMRKVHLRLNAHSNPRLFLPYSCDIFFSLALILEFSLILFVGVLVRPAPYRTILG